MFIGHYAVGLAAKKVAPQTSLGTLFLSVQLIDLLWPIFLLLGLEHVRIAPGNTAFTPLNFYDYPITHSLVGVLGWSVALGLIYFVITRYPRGAWVVGAGVLSHWVLDAVVHRPDLLLVPRGQTYVGLSLWNSVPRTLVVEGGMFVAGLALYLRATAARDRAGHYTLWSMVGLLVIIYIANALGPPPPSERAVAIVSLGAWLFFPWAYWVDRHRQVASETGAREKERPTADYH